MNTALHPRNTVDGLYVSRKEEERGVTNIEDCVDGAIQRPGRLHLKMQWKIDYSHQKQCRQRKHQQNKNNQLTKMGRKTTVWIFQAINKRNLTREGFDMTQKGKT